MVKVPIPDKRPKHGVLARENMQMNGQFIPNHAMFVRSGTIAAVTGSTTGSAALRLDAYGLRLRRIEIFHSGAAEYFDVTLESSTPNTGSFFDPRNVILEYAGVAGDYGGPGDFSCGIDQVEDFLAIADLSGNLYLKVKPHDTGLNEFIYLAFFEAVSVYIE